MTERMDSFDALRRPIPTGRPRPDFAVELRRRLMEELDMPTTADLPTTTSTDQGALRIVHLRVADADRAIQFYRSLFGWEAERYADDHVSHYTLNTSVTIRLIDDPTSAPVRPGYAVADVGAAVAAIEAAGGRVTQSGVEPDGGGWAYAEDAAGVPFIVNRPSNRAHATSIAPAEGDLGFVFITEDAGTARDFYSAVLGWDVREGHPGSHYHDAVNHVGVFDRNAAFGGKEPAAVSLFIEVPALRPALERLARLGGTAEPAPEQTTMGPYFAVQCEDDQGTTFGLVSTALG